MAEFNPKTKVDYQKEYDFRGFDGDTSFGKLLSGAAGIADNAIGAAYRSVEQGIQLEADESVSSIEDSLYGTTKIAAGHAATTNAGVAMPEDLARGFKDVQRLKSAYMKGAIRESDFLANVDVKAKQMRSKYGAQWQNEIDSALGQAMNSTANKYRRMLFADWDKESAQANKDFDDRMAILNKYPDWFAGSDMAKNPMAYTPLQMLNYVMPREAEKTRLQMANSAADLQLADGQLTDRTANQNLYDNTSNFISGMIDGQKSAIEAFQTKVSEYKKSDGRLDKNEISEINNYLDTLTIHAQQGFEKMLGQARYGNVSTSVLNMNKERVKSQIDTMRELALNEKTGWLGHNARNEAHRVDDLTYATREKDPQFAMAADRYAVFKEAGLDAPAEIWLSEETTKDTQNADQAIHLAAENYADPFRRSRFAYSLAKNRGDPSAFIKEIELGVHLLTSADSSPEGKRLVAKSLFNNENRSFLGAFANSGDERAAVEVYNSIVTPQVMVAMIEGKTNDRQLWGDFFKWTTFESPKVLYSKEFSDFAEQGLLSHQGLKFNGKEFELKKLPATAKTPPDRAELAASVAIVNDWVHRITPILEAEGTTLSEILPLIDPNLREIPGLEQEEEKKKKE